MSEPVVCGRESCQHRLRMHEQSSYGSGCLVTGCPCKHFVEPLGLMGLNMERIRNMSAPAGTAWEGRHPSVAHFDPLFAYNHLPPHLAEVSRPFNELAFQLLSRLNDGPELTTALRKLVEAKDCAVRQAVIDHG